MHRTFLFLACVVLVSWSLAQAQPAPPQHLAPPANPERPTGGAGAAEVLLVQDRGGRQVYTNLEGMASHGKAPRRLSLPPLASVDFEGAQAAELRALDLQVSESHDALQSGELCEAIRRTSRTPAWSRLWVDHGRKLWVAGALLVFAAILGSLGTGRRGGSLFPLVPILGGVFLGYVTYRDLKASRDAVTAGLRACSEQLPEGDPENKNAVRGRLSKALEVQTLVNGAFARQAEEIERIMREAR